MKTTDLLDPIRYVVSKSEHVHIHDDAIEEVARTFTILPTHHWSKIGPFTYTDLKRVEDEIDFRFLVDSMAFCFWGTPTKWTISYEGKELDGWWALLAAFKSALESGRSMLDGGYLSRLTIEDARRIFVGMPEIPLFRERFAILRGIGQVLVEKYDGRFHNFLKTAPGRALDLVQAVVEEFPGFDDTAKYRGKKIYFYKKAQLLVADLAKTKRIEKVIEITGLEQLTGKADYKIPALLRHLGILTYSNDLSTLVDNRKELPEGSLMEVEIRAGMLWATHLLTLKLQTNHPGITAVDLDYMLWTMSQKKSEDMKPYHLTRTVNY